MASNWDKDFKPRYADYERELAQLERNSRLANWLLGILVSLVFWTVFWLVGGST